MAPRPLTALSRLRLRARAFAVIFTGPLLLALGAAGSVVSVARSLAGRRLPSPAAIAGGVAVGLYAFVIRPRHLRWGTAPGDEDRDLPGDQLLSSDGLQILHEVTIDAPVGDVWPWLAQMGQDRGGFYSYEWLENLAGCEMRNADEIHPEWQHREIGDPVPLHPLNSLPVNLFEPGRAIGLEGWGNFVLEPLEGDRARLLIRGRVPRGAATAGYAALFEIPHFLMQRKMLLGIKERAERRHARAC